MNQQGEMKIVELSENDAYLRKIGSRYATPYYFDVSVCRETETEKLTLSARAKADLTVLEQVSN